MTQRAIRLLGALAVLAGFFFAAPAANAAVTETPVTSGGITCQRRDGGTYPENGKFYYCGTNAGNKFAVLNLAKQILSAKAQVNTRFAAAPVEFYVFVDAMEFEAFRVAHVLSPAEKQAAYNTYMGINGFSNPPSAGPARFIAVFENAIPQGGAYPSTTALNQTTMKQTTSHEMGHNYDWLLQGAAFGGVYPSASAEYDRVIKGPLSPTPPKYSDEQFTDSQIGAPAGNALRQQYSYWLVKDATKKWAELYAEEFASHVGGTVATPVQVDAINKTYYECSRVFVKISVDFARQPLSGEYPARCRP